MGDVGRVLILLGIFLMVAGLVLQLAGRVPWLGRLPGDILIQRRNFSLYLPLTTCLLASLDLTLILWALSRLR
jgi:hypothetical protein